ncbi:MAG: hypothetical protein O7G84_13825 [Gammaproteobacteria bacterium]|nr:hypothetical protein [Gammaproteobacteria bacterium]
MAAKKKVAKKMMSLGVQVRELRMLAHDALAILEDNRIIDPFARRDARELLRGFIHRTK